MKKYVVLFTACFLVGCPGPGDKLTPRFPAVVTAKDNHVCILSSMKAGDNIRFVQIYSESGDKLIKAIDNDVFFVEPGRCMPVFDYAFRTGKCYSVAYDIQTPEGSHLITAAFMVVSDERGNLRVND